MKTVADWIENELRKQTAGKKISTQNRLAELVKRINSNIDALAGVTIDGHSLDEAEIRRCKIFMPYATREVYTATASENHPCDKARSVKKLSFEVITF